MDFFSLYKNPVLLAILWPRMSFPTRCRFFSHAKKWREVEETARAFAAELRIVDSLAKEIGRAEAEALWKALNDDMSAFSAFWQSGAGDGTDSGGEPDTTEKECKYKHLSFAERVQIITLRGLKYGIRKIAKLVGRNPSTVSRELRRFSSACSLVAEYNAENAQKMYESLRRHCGRKSVLTQSVIDKICDLMKKRRLTPEQIAQTDLKGIASKTSIYRGFDRGIFSSEMKKYLWRRGRKRRKSQKIAKYNTGRSIHDRPIDVLLRMEFGHWEVDTVESCRKGTGCVFVLHERKTRFTITCRSLFFDAKSMKKYIIKTIRRFPKGVFKSITCDRGKEFAEYLEIEEKTGVAVYFADPHSPNQKGSVEHANGLIRRFFPKGTDFGKINSTILYHKAISFINAWPMEVLEWKTPRQAFLSELTSL